MTVENLHRRLASLFELFKDKAYFKKKTELTHNYTPSSLSHDAIAFLGFNPFPFHKWSADDLTEENLFNTFEFLYDRVSKPGEWGYIRGSAGDYEDYLSYDEDAGKKEYKDAADAILRDWKDGFQLDGNGRIETLGTGGLEFIFSAGIIPFDEVNVDSKVRTAIAKYRGRHATDSDKKEAVRIMADVFEFLQKTNQLKNALDASDSSDLFHIANGFAIRHHNQKQKSNYDTGIWYAWMFHFYLATYHAAVRQIVKKKPKTRAKI
jgi:hypothetical protein